jgi:demethylmenaquinone methyltransferase/2-methoxy-6-polyprenyl-1,4-benzoquinol methylase
MFGRIAGRYDLINSLISLGQNRRWKDLTARACRLPSGGLALDVCAGTGDIALAMARRGARVAALDFSAEMLAIAREKARGRPIFLVQADALDLPFADHVFDAAAVGFSLRNVASLPRLVAEMARVVRPGGWVVSLETSQPPSLVMRASYRAYLRAAISLAPLLSEGSAYRYLADTIGAFPPAEEIAEAFRAAGLRQVRFQRLLFGVVAIHAGQV